VTAQQRLRDDDASVLDLAQSSAKLARVKERSEPGFRYADLFAGIGGFHAMLDHAGGRCVYVSEIDAAARATYTRNWVEPLHADVRPVVNTDITLDTAEGQSVTVPPHDVLAAGFPCQPFSKSGFQRGMDEARGTLFWNIARVLQARTPAIVLLENVRNLAGPRHAHEWEVIIETLREIGYRVSPKPTVFSPHLLPPHRGGTPQIRDRVFILGTYIGPAAVRAELAAGLVPEQTVQRKPVEEWSVDAWDAAWILDDDARIRDLQRYRLDSDETTWIDTWDDLVQRMRYRTGLRLPGFPLWADHWVPERALDPDELAHYPAWKSKIVVKNARFYDENRVLIDAWRQSHPEFVRFPASRRKLEWQAREAESLWETVMHLRPSGIRAKDATYLPALVAINQTSVFGPRRRRLTPHEAARLQGLPTSFSFGNQKDSASYKQVGNGVAVGAAWHVFREHVLRDANDLPQDLVATVMQAAVAPPGIVTPRKVDSEVAQLDLAAS
jgi:DNA (cytosine-5)-methyltransferase 1